MATIGKTIGESVGNLAGALAGFGFSNIQPASVGNSANAPRREWRINANTGDLRGVYFVHRGKERRPAYYIGKREKPDEFNKIYPAFEAWRRANRTLTSVGILPD